MIVLGRHFHYCTCIDKTLRVKKHFLAKSFFSFHIDVKELQPLFSEVISEFLSDAAGAAVRQAITLQQEEDEGSQMVIHLSRHDENCSLGR